MHDISFTVHIFKEGPTYVAYVPELDLSSCGATHEEARKNVCDAVRGFLETSAAMGTLPRFSKNPAISAKAKHGGRRSSCRLTVLR